ncbi:hypothetical protein O0I10_007505, partial [Lichtheimia ornata]
MKVSTSIPVAFIVLVSTLNQLAAAQTTSSCPAQNLRSVQAKRGQLLENMYTIRLCMLMQVADAKGVLLGYMSQR